MHIIHSFKDKKIDEHLLPGRDAAFLITNKKGNYLSLGTRNFTHMQGLYFLEHEQWALFKTIDDIRLDKKVTSIRNSLHSAQRIYDSGAEESFTLFNNSLLYSVSKYSGSICLDMDFREMFNFHDQGRIYSVTQEDGCIIIRYDKHSDFSLSKIVKTRFMAIKGAPDFQLISEWVKKSYGYDEKRKSFSELYTFRAISIPVSHSLELVFSFADDKERAKEHAEAIYGSRHYLLTSCRQYANHTFTSRDLALNVAMKALDDLLISTDRKERGVGIVAGLPWFCQFWARDELISLKALMLQEKHYLVKSILFKYLGLIGLDGLIPSKFPAKAGDVKSIDSVGWLFLRVRDYLKALEPKRKMQEYLSEQDLLAIKRHLEHAIHGLSQSHGSAGLITNNEQETWMDTKPARRRGACIEIQALFLAMLRLHTQMASLTRTRQLFKSTEKDFKESVRKAFFKGQMLHDSITEQGPADAIRPNVFLAYYAYPDLLSKKEWKIVFDNTLRALWLDWGGLATINYTSPLFRAQYTGEGDESYHNGDSWYYINNYAALAMHRLDKQRYSKHIARIAHASKEEMLFSGFIGCCAEVSSAKHMKSEGCLSQAWSAASLIELLHELHGN